MTNEPYYFTIHKEIKEYVDKLAEDEHVTVVHEAAVKLGIDPQMVKNHLEMMEMDNYGAFVDENGTVFATVKWFTKVAQKAIGSAWKPKEG